MNKEARKLMNISRLYENKFYSVQTDVFARRSDLYRNVAKELKKWEKAFDGIVMEWIEGHSGYYDRKAIEYEELEKSYKEDCMKYGYEDVEDDKIGVSADNESYAILSKEFGFFYTAALWDL